MREVQVGCRFFSLCLQTRKARRRAGGLLEACFVQLFVSRRHATCLTQQLGQAPVPAEGNLALLAAGKKRDY